MLAFSFSPYNIYFYSIESIAQVATFFNCAAGATFIKKGRPKAAFGFIE
jgi:hypothetical protein